MKQQELNRQLQKLKDLISKTDSASALSAELRSHWAKYICVIASGFLENSLKLIYTDFVKNASSEPVANFTSSTLSKIQNPKTDRFIEIARKFKSKWAEDLEKYVDESDRKDAIDSIMNNRHQIVHGKQSGITIARVKQYIEKSIEVVIFIENQCLA